MLGIRLGGYRTTFAHLPISQTNALTITPTLYRRLGSNLRVSTGLSADVPGTTLNENALQTVGAQMTVEAGF